uniref:C-C motif chemokine n=1 Tax=Astyanax mexicanus TaxID=7994 RepID=A0A3B1IDG1_ASTMX
MVFRCALSGLISEISCFINGVGSINVNAVKSCCFNFQIRKIPLNAIIKYENVDRDCPISGVIFTVRTSRVCADPNQSWVQQLEKPLVKTTATTLNSIATI